METRVLYNNVPENTKLTHKRLRMLICELYKIEGNWENVSMQTKTNIWLLIENKELQKIVGELTD